MHNTRPNLCRAAPGDHHVYPGPRKQTIFAYVQSVRVDGEVVEIHGWTAAVSPTVAISGRFVEPHRVKCTGDCAFCGVCRVPGCACCHAPLPMRLAVPRCACNRTPGTDDVEHEDV